MSLLLKWTGWNAKGSGQGELRPGDRGDGDSPFTYCDTKPDFFYSLTQVYGAESSKQKSIYVANFAGQRSCIGFENFDNTAIGPNKLPLLETINAPYSMYFEMQLASPPTPANFDFLTFRSGGHLDDGGVRKLGLRINIANVFVAGADVQRMAIMSGSTRKAMSVNPVSGAAYTTGTQKYRIELSVSATNYVTVTGWAMGSSIPTNASQAPVFKITQQLTGAEVSFDTIEFGCNDDTYPAGVLQAPPIYIKNILVYDTDVTAGGTTPIGFYDKRVGTQINQPTFSEWDGSTATELTLEGRLTNSGNVVPLDSVVSKINGTTGAVTHIPVDESVRGIALAGTSVYATHEGVNQFSKIVIGTSAVTKSTVGTGSRSVAYDGIKYLWIINRTANGVIRYNVSTGVIEAGTIDIGDFPAEIIYAQNSLWATSRSTLLNPGSLTTIKTLPIPRTKITRITPTPPANTAVAQAVIVLNNTDYTAKGIASQGTNIWVACSNDNEESGGDRVYKVDATTNNVTASVSMPQGSRPFGVLSAAGYIWVTNSGSNTVSKIDPTTNTIVGSPIPVGDSPRGIAYDGTRIWVANTGSGDISKINPATSTVSSTIDLHSSPYSMVWDGTNMWVSNAVDMLLSSPKLSQPPYTSYFDIDMGGGDPTVNGSAAKGDLHIPDGEPPVGGWPTVLWAFSGFFVSGKPTDIPEDFKQDLINNGYAVLCVGYRLAKLASATPAVHWPKNLIDYKACGRWVETDGSDYDLSPTRKFATGYSAGGFLAKASMLTKDITDDGSAAHRDLTYSGGDPDFLGAFSWAGPIDMGLAVATEPIPSIPVVTLAWQILSNQPGPSYNYDGLRLQEYVAANDKPIGYCYGRWDELVPSFGVDNQLDPFIDAFDTAGTSGLLSLYTTMTDHDSMLERYNSNPIPAPTGSQHVIDWMQEVEGP
jgi:YVTN family beta-propeller protein